MQSFSPRRFYRNLYFDQDQICIRSVKKLRVGYESHKLILFLIVPIRERIGKILPKKTLKLLEKNKKILMII